MTDLTQLHKALSEAESGSRELDALFIGTLVINGVELDDMRRHLEGIPHEFTTDLNAITSLIERKLPPIKGFSDKPSEGWKFGVHRGLVPGLWTAWIRKHAEDGVNNMAPTPALALCIALVSALIAQEGEK